MKTTMNINESLISEAMNLSHAKNKTEAVHEGLKALIKKYKIESVKRLAGSGMFRNDYNHKDVRRENDSAIKNNG